MDVWIYVGWMDVFVWMNSLIDGSHYWYMDCFIDARMDLFMYWWIYCFWCLDLLIYGWIYWCFDLLLMYWLMYWRMDGFIDARFCFWWIDWTIYWWMDLLMDGLICWSKTNILMYGFCLQIRFRFCFCRCWRRLLSCYLQLYPCLFPQG